MRFCSIVSTFLLQNTRLKGSFDQIGTLKNPKKTFFVSSVLSSWELIDPN